MSFFTKIKTELKNRQYVLLALGTLKKTGEITMFENNESKDTIEIDRSGDIVTLSRTETGEYQLAGDARVVNAFANRLKQVYAYESIKDNLPLDFEISEESEMAGEINIVLKG